MHNRRFYVALATLCFVSAISTAQGQSNPDNEIPPMRRLYVQDQRDRGVLLSDTGQALPPNSAANPPEQVDTETQQKRDAERRQQVRELISAGKLTTAQDFHDAAYIFQHGQEPGDYLLAHILAVEAVVKGDASSRWISAATLDRYLQAIGQSQVFGTQYSDRDFLFFTQHKNDLAAIKAHKPEPGKTQQPYDDRLMPDPLRLDFCVPTRAQQQLNLKDFEATGHLKHIDLPGCTR